MGRCDAETQTPEEERKEEGEAKSDENEKQHAQC